MTSKVQHLAWSGNHNLNSPSPEFTHFKISNFVNFKSYNQMVTQKSDRKKNNELPIIHLSACGSGDILFFAGTGVHKIFTRRKITILRIPQNKFRWGSYLPLFKMFSA